MDKYHNILDLIGNTPMVEINRLNPNKKVKILVKLESYNPGGSVKDRIALTMIEKAEEKGYLTREKTVIEPTSGNTGIGLALVCVVKGYKLLLTMPESVSLERKKILQALGADVLLTPARLGTDGAIEEAYKLARENKHKFFLPDQFNNPSNVLAHYHGTAEEIWRQTEGRVTMVVATMGTTGTLMGVSKRLKEYNPHIKVIGVEPYLGHNIQGLKNMKESYRPGIFDKTQLDEKINIDDEEAFDMARKLAQQEGLFVGMSSGAAMAAAEQKASELDSGVIVVIFPDGGERYLSTPLFLEKVRPELKFYNTLTRQKEPFVPLVEGKVSMYSCGPTVHEKPHLGNLRRFVVADLIKRYLEYKDYEVTHIMNITDIDDKTIKGAEEVGMELKPFTEIYTKEFLDNIDALRIKPATMYPKASEHIEDMLAITRKLLEKGYAYEKLHSVYFDISRFRNYGNLSKIDLGKIRLGSTVDLDSYEKDNPRDFTLLKRSSLSELKKGIYYGTEWGNIRPGWHIECAAMCMKYLGRSFDIHTSGTDLIFPHHENEIAICEAVTEERLVNYWLHSELVLVDGKKMSRSSDNYYILEDLLNRGYEVREVRYWLLSTHYRKPLNFSLEALDEARRSLRKLDEFIAKIKHMVPGESNPQVDQLIYQAKQDFSKGMDEDLNISVALASLFRLIKGINPFISKGHLDHKNMGRILSTLKRFDSVLQVMRFEDVDVDDETKRLIQERDLARKQKKWDVADQIREELLKRGIIVGDTKEGSWWRKIPSNS